MKLSTIPSKIGQLSDIGTKEGRIRQLFILADGKRDFSELFSICKIEPQEGLKLAAIMVKKGLLQIGALSKKESQAGEVIEQESAGGGSALIDTEEFVKGVTAELAKYVGPVAEIIMDDFALSGAQTALAVRRDIFKKLSEEFDSQEEYREFMKMAKEKQWL